MTDVNGVLPADARTPMAAAKTTKGKVILAAGGAAGAYTGYYVGSAVGAMVAGPGTFELIAGVAAGAAMIVPGAGVAGGVAYAAQKEKK